MAGQIANLPTPVSEVKVGICRVLEVTTNIGCNLGCIYCPQAVINRAFKRSESLEKTRFFSDQDFTNCLATVPNTVDVHFSGFSEPWHHPNATEFLLQTHEKGHRVGVFTTADKMTTGDVEQMSRVPFKRFTVHLPDADGMMRLSVTSEYLETLRALKKANVSGLGFMTIGRVHPEIVDALGETSATNRVHSRASNIAISEVALMSSPTEDRLRARTEGKQIGCRANRMFANVVVPGGGLYLCSMDYALEEPIGNLLTASYRDLVGGAPLQKIIEKLKDPQSDVICRKCEYAVAGQYD